MAVNRPASETAIPADSWPRCCSAWRPKYVSRATSRSGARMPNTPHISGPSRSDRPELHEILPGQDSVGPAGDHDPAFILVTTCYLARGEAAPGGRLGQRLRHA